jgi:hypothetical protein
VFIDGRLGIKQGKGEGFSIGKNGDFAHMTSVLCLEPGRFFGRPPVIARQSTVFRKPSRESTDDLLWVGDREVVSASLDRDEFGGRDECLNTRGVFVRHRIVRSSLYVIKLLVRDENEDHKSHLTWNSSTRLPLSASNEGCWPRMGPSRSEDATAALYPDRCAD